MVQCGQYVGTFTGELLTPEEAAVRDGQVQRLLDLVQAGLIMQPVMSVTRMHSTWISGILGSLAHQAHLWSLTRHEPAMSVSRTSTTALLMFRQFTRFLNHSCDANLSSIGVFSNEVHVSITFV